jgi:hypothetical protein
MRGFVLAARVLESARGYPLDPRHECSLPPKDQKMCPDWHCADRHEWCLQDQRPAHAWGVSCGGRCGYLVRCRDQPFPNSRAVASLDPRNLALQLKN